MKPEVAGVREEVRCPECGKYDTDLGATHPEHKLLMEAARTIDPRRSFAKELIYCECYDNSTDDGSCPHCKSKIDEVYEYFSPSDEEVYFQCPNCDKNIRGYLRTSYVLHQSRTGEPEE